MALDFENGAGWQLCWNSRDRENIVLSDIHYRNSGGESLKVISSLRLSQLHVSYDDSTITYNDVTQFGLGAGFVSALDEADCPGGERIVFNGQPGLCKLRSSDGEAYHTNSETRQQESVSLLSISQVGSYAYLVTWKFLDDGSIAPSIGAAGALQRSSEDAGSPYGRELEGVPNKSWLSHTHNYYWRIDFDIGSNSNDDTVSEVSYRFTEDGRRERLVTPLLKEAARAVDPSTMTSWFISSESENMDQAPGYVIEPLHYGHRLVRTVTEPYTEFDFFVTRHNDCERFASENAKFNPDCAENVLEFVNDESLENEDIVVWHRISFHHVPRNEDRHDMHSHWDGFVMQARNLSPQTPGHSGTVSNSAPLVTAMADQVNRVDDNIDLAILGNDPDGDVLHYVASGLPDGIRLGAHGHLSGTPQREGHYHVTVAVKDNENTSSTHFNWKISPAEASGQKSGAAWPLVWLCILFIGIRSVPGRRH